MRVGPIRPGAVADLANAAPVTDQERALADGIAQDARRLAPVVSGALRRSIAVVETTNPETGETEFRVGWDRAIAYYGFMVEAGTADTPAQPHLRPAAIKARG